LSSREFLRVLIVEDEILIALELESLLQDAGHEVVGIAACSADAAAMAGEQQPDLAFVDIHLADGPTGVGLARHLAHELGVTVLFMTANAKRIPEDFAGAKGVIAKPYTERSVRQAIAYVLAGDRDADPQAPAEAMTFCRFLGSTQDDGSGRRA
jgi:two-component system, response regulator PdtaR